LVTRALVLAGGGVAGIAWETGLIVGLAEAGVDVRNADLFVGTSAGSTVAAQITSGLAMDVLYNRQVDPALRARELPARPDLGRMIADFTRIYREAGGSSEILRRIGALALSTATVAESNRRDVIVSRLPSNRWPRCRLEIVTVDAISGERVVFTRESGVDIVDAVTASCAIPCVWPPATIDGRHYIDGGCYSMSNADLATGFAKVILLEPDVPPFPVIESSYKEVDRLRLNGAQVEVISPNEPMKAALAAAAGNLLDPSLATIAAKIGREQAGKEAERITRLWGQV